MVLFLHGLCHMHHEVTVAAYWSDPFSSLCDDLPLKLFDLPITSVRHCFLMLVDPDANDAFS